MFTSITLVLPSDDERLVALYTAKLLVRVKEPALLVQQLRSSQLFMHLDQDLPLIRQYYKVMRDEISKTSPDKLYAVVDATISEQNEWPVLSKELFDADFTF